MDLDGSPNEADPISVPLLKENSGQVVADTTDCGGATGDEIPLQEIHCNAQQSNTESELQEFHADHRRLLPNFKNAVHIIDGPEHRYFVGIIDIFTVYGWRKKLENLWKRLRYPGRAFSTVSPPDYSQRFCQWAQKHTQ